jgi:hypothetical protein
MGASSDQAVIQQILEASASVENAMHKYLGSGNGIDYPVGFEMYLEEFLYSDSLQFGRNMSPERKEFQRRTSLFELVVDIPGAFDGIVCGNIGKNPKEVFFGVRNQKDLIVHADFAIL